MTHMILEGAARTPRHTSAYLECGPRDGPLIVFLHGWPELAISWRHQLRCFADLGFRAVAPDMRGYGRSTVHARHEDYAVEAIATDMLELLAALGRERAVWVGHDWGAPIVWSLASHHADRCMAVANLCVPYLPDGFALPNLVRTVDRALYPEAEFPFGQWDYMAFYEESFGPATAALDADPHATVRALFRAGNPAARGKPARTATTRRVGGWFGPAGRAPEISMDPAVLDAESLGAYASALTRNGFFGPNAWYMNGDRNAAYAARAPNGGRLGMPVLFLHGAHDLVCDSIGSSLAEPMRAVCDDLTEATVASGHWMAQERPREVNAAIAAWLARRVPGSWPG